MPLPCYSVHLRWTLQRQNPAFCTCTCIKIFHFLDMCPGWQNLFWMINMLYCFYHYFGYIENEAVQRVACQKSVNVSYHAEHPESSMFQEQFPFRQNQHRHLIWGALDKSHFFLHTSFLWILSALPIYQGYSSLTSTVCLSCLSSIFRSSLLSLVLRRHFIQGLVIGKPCFAHDMPLLPVCSRSKAQ